MTNPISKLVLAAVLLSSIPLAASADGREGWGRDRDCDRDRDPAGWSQPGAPYGQPDAYAPYTASDRPASGAWRAWRERREWHERREWREHERAEVSAQLRALDAERDRFYAENGWRPGRARRFERYYAFRRAELERRWYELQPVAWR
jgi:hypothetical protein